MNIGIDIDGVITDMERYELDYGTKFCVEERLPININVKEYAETNKFKWTEEQAEKFWNRYLIKYVIESNTREFAPDVIKKLKEDGNKIYIITARDEYGMPPEYYGKMQKLTQKWLKKQNIKYNKLIFASNKEKLSQCIENEIDIMLEDCPDNILNISSKLNVIKFDCQYNKHIEGENITTAYSWYDIYEIIEKMKEE